MPKPKAIKPPYITDADGTVSELTPKKHKPMPDWWLWWIIPLGLWLAGWLVMQGRLP